MVRTSPKMAKPTSRTAVVLLLAGLLLATVFPSLGSRLHLSDAVRGFVTGVGLTFELAALLLFLHQKRDATKP